MRIPIPLITCVILLSSGLTCGYLVTSAIDRAMPLPMTHEEAISAGWIEGTDGYWQARTGQAIDLTPTSK
jgi:hypothetical protein